jgi:ComF family protein
MIFQDLFNLFFPDLCIGCKKILLHQEKHLCISCLHDLPLTKLHYSDSKLISNIFYGHVVLEHATALFFFPKEGAIRQLIHQLKYKNQKDISSYLGDWLGFELRECNYFNEIDVIIPVPLHKSKLKSRGYNQVADFGKIIAKNLNATYNETSLIRIKNTTTQTMKDRINRLRYLDTIFEVSKCTSLQGKHILLVDDVITTGATIKACAKELNKIPDIKISLAVMAYTDN